LVWENEPLNPKDAVHVATAIRHDIMVFDTFDQKLIKLNGKPGNPPIRIGTPDLPFQGDLFPESEEEE